MVREGEGLQPFFFNNSTPLACFEGAVWARFHQQLVAGPRRRVSGGARQSWARRAAMAGTRGLLSGEPVWQPNALRKMARAGSQLVLPPNNSHRGPWAIQGTTQMAAVMVEWGEGEAESKLRDGEWGGQRPAASKQSSQTLVVLGSDKQKSPNKVKSIVLNASELITWIMMMVNEEKSWRH